MQKKLLAKPQTARQPPPPAPPLRCRAATLPYPTLTGSGFLFVFACSLAAAAPGGGGHKDDFQALDRVGSRAFPLRFVSLKPSERVSDSKKDFSFCPALAHVMHACLSWMPVCLLLPTFLLLSPNHTCGNQYASRASVTRCCCCCLDVSCGWLFRVYLSICPVSRGRAWLMADVLYSTKATSRKRENAPATA